MIKISIVIPIYNAERYIAEMLSSIVNQTMRDIQIICINDASTDNSLSIVEKFADKDRRIVVIKNSSNKGAAISRNKGIEISYGDYICFLDADDIYAVDLIEREYDAIRKYDADIAVVHSASFRGEFEKCDLYYNEIDFQWKEQCVSMDNANRNLLVAWTDAPWNKMYKREFIMQHHLFFQNLTSSNDVYFGAMAILYAKRIVLVESDNPLVFYRTGTGTQISASRSSRNVYLAFEKIHNSMIEWKLWENYFEQFFDSFCAHIFSGYRRCSDEIENYQTYNYIAKEGLRNCGFFEINEQQFKDKRLYQKLLKCLHCSYSSGWFRFRKYEEFLDWNVNKIMVKLQQCYETGRILVIWGAAARAEAFIRLCQKNNYMIQYIVDQDMSKHGKELCGIKICKFEDVSNIADIVLVLRSDYYEEIRDTVKRINCQIDVWDFEKYLLQ